MRHPLVRPVDHEPASLYVVTQAQIKNFVFEVAFQFLVLDGDHQLHPPVEISKHPIGAADVDILFAAVQKIEYTAMLKEPSYDACDRDRCGEPRHARPERTHPPHDQLDRHTGLRCLIQSSHELGIGETVQLCDDAGGTSGRIVIHLTLDQLHEAIPKIDRCYQKPSILSLSRETGEIIEQLGSVISNLLVCGEQPQIGVDLRGCRIIVPGAEMDVPSEGTPFTPYDERQLAMRLQP